MVNTGFKCAWLLHREERWMDTRRFPHCRTLTPAALPVTGHSKKLHLLNKINIKKKHYFCRSVQNTLVDEDYITEKASNMCGKSWIESAAWIKSAPWPRAITIKSFVHIWSRLLDTWHRCNTSPASKTQRMSSGRSVVLCYSHQRCCWCNQ